MNLYVWQLYRRWTPHRLTGWRTRLNSTISSTSVFERNPRGQRRSQEWKKLVPKPLKKNNPKSFYTIWNAIRLSVLQWRRRSFRRRCSRTWGRRASPKPSSLSRKSSRTASLRTPISPCPGTEIRFPFALRSHSSSLRNFEKHQWLFHLRCSMYGNRISRRVALFLYLVDSLCSLTTVFYLIFNFSILSTSALLIGEGV